MEAHSWECKSGRPVPLSGPVSTIPAFPQLDKKWNRYVTNYRLPTGLEHLSTQMSAEVIKLANH